MMMRAYGLRMKLVAVLTLVFSIITCKGDELFQDLLGGDVAITLRGADETIALTKNYDLTIELTHPVAWDVKMPTLESLKGRFQGFSLVEGYEDEVEADGRICHTFRLNLTPDVTAERFRLAPFAVEVTDAGGVKKSEITSSVLFPMQTLENAEGDAELNAKPFFIFPTARELAVWALCFAGVVLALWGLGLCYKKVQSIVRIKRLSPTERALRELRELLAKGLTEKGLFKDYYIELTHVVRRYIERRYKIRAPKLTTEEFLQTAKSDEGFNKASIQYLENFLYSADMVKFAGVKATQELAASAAASAENYLENDALTNVVKEL